MNTQEAVETIKNIDTLNINDRIAGQQVGMVIKNQVLDIINQIDEPKKVVIPKFVADFIKRVKTSNFVFKNYHGYEDWLSGTDDVFRVMYYILKEGVAGYTIKSWVDKNKDAFARAWLDGYEC